MIEPQTQTAAGKILIAKIERMRDKLRHSGQKRPKIRALEINYGLGEDLFPLLKMRGTQIQYLGYDAGIDNAIEIWAKIEALKKTQTLHLAAGQFLSTDIFRKDFFDVAYSHGFFDQLQSDQERDKFLKKLREHLNSAGKAIITAKSAGNAESVAGLDWTVHEMFRILSRNGFKPLEAFAAEDKQPSHGRPTHYTVYHAEIKPR